MKHGIRDELPTRRPVVIQKVKINGQTLHLGMGLYPDDRPGEIFVDMHQTGSAFRAVMNAFAIILSLALQYGVPLNVIVKSLEDIEFEPRGPVSGSPHVTECRSPIDYVMRELALTFGGN